MKAVIIIGVLATIGFIAFDWIVLEPKRDAEQREANARWMRYVNGVGRGDE